VYTTESLNKSITIIGDVIVELVVSSTADYKDFVIELMDVMTDGRSIELGSKTAEQLHARSRHGFYHEILMSPNQIYLIHIDLHAIGHTFLPNHRIRLAITSSFFSWISVNPNTREPIVSDIQSPIVANQAIHYAHNQLSQIRMMVVDDPICDEDFIHL
jgi:putative CocE/NonD family hydrolase